MKIPPQLWNNDNRQTEHTRSTASVPPTSGYRIESALTRLVVRLILAGALVLFAVLTVASIGDWKACAGAALAFIGTAVLLTADLTYDEIEQSATPKADA